MKLFTTVTIEMTIKNGKLLFNRLATGLVKSIMVTINLLNLINAM